MSDHYWLVCHTKPRCEKKFAALMAAEKFEHYLALIESVRRYAQQTKRFMKPLFPGYVFAKVPIELKARIYQQETGASQDIGIELLFARGIRADCRDVGPRL